MRELLRTTDVVELSWARAVLLAVGIEPLVFDDNIAVTEGGILAFPQRLMVAESDWERGRIALDGARVALAASNDP